METTVNAVWQKSKLLVKGFIIGALVLLLLIPAYFVKNLVQEREQRQKEAVTEVSSKWAAGQTITGPILVVPYQERITDANGKALVVRHNAYFLPDKLQVRSSINPVEKHRGIYQVMLYSSTTVITGKFSPLPLAKMKLSATDMIWSEAYVCLDISDVRGLKDEINLKWNDTVMALAPTMVDNALMKDAFSTPVTLTETDIPGEITFSTELRLNGSEQLMFTPVGKATTVELNSAWPDPSFSGSQLPDTSSVKKSGFSASWTSFSHTRNFPQHWKDDKYYLEASSFGAGLFVPVSGYQKTMRSVKYAILCILLTFTAFFLIETTNKRSVHPVHYALIGFALILFYTLLLSLSEYTGFNIAYAIAGIATIGLIGWFVKSLLQSSRLSLLLSFILVLLYTYVFTTLQLQDYALLIGSIGLFLALATVMFFSKKIQW